MAIDQGTTGTTVSLIQEDGSSLAKVNEEFPQVYPQSGWVEHDPEQIWQSVLSCIQKALDMSRVEAKNIAAIGITNQRETSLIWELKTGKPIYNAIVWQCRRTTAICEKLKKAGHEKLIKKKTGLVLDPYFSGTKFQWLLDNVPQARRKAREGQLLGGTIDTYLLWKLTGGKSHKTDVSNASRTMLMNIEKPAWDSELLKILKVPKEILPEIVPSSGIFGVTSHVPGLPDGIPISGIAGDQQAALFGQTCFQAGQAKCTFGTGSFLVMNTGKKIVRSQSGLLTTVAWQLKGETHLTYALEGGAFICGAAVQWLRDGLKFFKESSEIEALAATVESTEGVEVIPAFTGLGAPYWDPEARGAILGITRGTNRAHIARATLEAMALQNVEILLAMQKDLGKNLADLRVDGGAVQNNLLLQLQSDFLGKKIIRPLVIETTSSGAAYLAGLGIGFWTSISDIKKVWQMEREFQPKISSQVRNLRLKTWKNHVAQVMYNKGLKGLYFKK
ncbi:MAG: glycerol kinase GlpK [Bdellovibrionaceae bacterium]|nr:glycerol kinase GlpK [Pseudobdellovibrionaceae bacterium]